MAKSSRLAKAFTLIEILLCVILVLALITSVVINFQPSNSFREEKIKVETILRFTKAQAANTGKKFKLTSLTNSIKVEFEKDGLQKPGEFQTFDLGMDTKTEITLDFQPILFYCDGWNEPGIISITFDDKETLLKLNEFGGIFEDTVETNIVEK